jgi:hypothetical protein
MSMWLVREQATSNNKQRTKRTREQREGGRGGGARRARARVVSRRGQEGGGQGESIIRHQISNSKVSLINKRK